MSCIKLRLLVPYLLSNQAWSLQTPPRCEAVSCEKTPLSPHLQLYNDQRFSAGDVAKFRCGPGHSLAGSPVSWCGADGTWSPSWTKISCVSSCVYPGAIIHGHISPVLFYYREGRTVQYSCPKDFRLVGKPVLTCGKRGRWDAALPKCVKIRLD